MDDLSELSNLSGHQVGRWSENRVRSVLEYLKQEGILRGFRKTRPYSRADKRGVDFYLFTENDRIPLQVKSCNQAKAMHDYYTWGAGRIPCVVGRWTWQKLVDQIRRIIGGANGNTAR